MKKVFAVAAIALTLASCGSSNTAPVANDSTAVKVDSAKVDTTVAPTADTTATK